MTGGPLENGGPRDETPTCMIVEIGTRITPVCVHALQRQELILRSIEETTPSYSTWDPFDSLMCVVQLKISSRPKG